MYSRSWLLELQRGGHLASGLPCALRSTRPEHVLGLLLNPGSSCTHFLFRTMFESSCIRESPRRGKVIVRQNAWPTGNICSPAHTNGSSCRVGW